MLGIMTNRGYFFQQNSYLYFSQIKRENVIDKSVKGEQPLISKYNDFIYLFYDIL